MKMSLNCVSSAERLTKLEYAATEIFALKIPGVAPDDKDDIQAAARESIEAAVILLNELEDFQQNPK